MPPNNTTRQQRKNDDATEYVGNAVSSLSRICNPTVMNIRIYNPIFPLTWFSHCKCSYSVLPNCKSDRVEESVQPSASDVEAINGLRNLLPSANIVTMEWQPLGNVTSITDGRGFRTDYEYDSSGRLVEESFTEDGSKYVLKTHKYHYHAGQ